MPPIVSDGQLNLAALQTDDVYIIVVPPQTPLIPGFPTDGIGIIGTASRGTPNTPYLVGSPQDLIKTFGDLSTSAFDLVTEVLGAMKQGATTIYGVRVTDGSDVIAKNDITDSASGKLVEFDAISSGIWGNGVNVLVGVGSNNVATAPIGTITISGAQTALDLIRAVVGGSTATYTVATGDTIQSVAAGLAAAINNSTTVSTKVTATVSGAVVILTGTVKGTINNGTALANTGSTVPSNVTVSAATLGGSAVSPAQAGTGTQTYKVIITSTYDPTEIFDNLGGIAGVGATSAAATIISAVNNGVTGVRGPSNIVTAKTSTGPGSGTLLNQSITLTGGTDGRAGVSATTLVGVDGLTRTGMYALRGIPVFQFGLAGMTDTTQWSNINAFATSESMVAVVLEAVGTSSQTGVQTKNVAALDDYHSLVVKDWLYLNDTFNKQIRLVSPLGATLGRLGALSPERSPGNKPIQGFIGTERSVTFAANGTLRPLIPYSSAEIGLLEQNGILFMTQPSVGGNYLSLRHGQNSSSDPTRNGINYSRMTLFLARSLVGAFGFVIGEVHTATLRRRVVSAISQFLGSLADPGPGRSPMIGDVNGGPAYSIVCDVTNNPSNLVAQGYLYCTVQVKYLSIVRFFVLSLEGGQSVTVRVQQSPVLRSQQAA